MSTVVVLAPIIVANWPMITAAVSAAVGTMGFALVRQQETAGTAQASRKTREEIEVDNSEILAGTEGGEQRIVVQREGLQAVFTRDARGSLRVCLEGEGYSKSQLRQLGEELVEQVTQQYVYHRVVTELKARHMTMVDEEVTEDRTVRIRVRSW